MKKLRAQKIEIDLPTEDAPVWIHAVVQRVIKDDESYETKQVTDMVAHVNRSITNVSMEMETIYDPVTQQTVTVSGAGASIIIKAFVLRWLAEDFKGTLNDVGDFIES